MITQAIEKINKELEGAKNSGAAKEVAEYLIKNITPELAARIVIEKKSLKGCINSITNEAQKKAQNRCAFLTDEEVFKMATDYFYSDQEDKPEIKATVTTSRQPEAQKPAENKPVETEKKNKTKKEISTSQVSIFDMFGQPEEEEEQEEKDEEDKNEINAEADDEEAEADIEE